MKEWTGDNTDEFSVMSRQEVRAFDARAVKERHVPSILLMENAGQSGAEVVLKLLKETGGSRVCIFCGAGNNGGDGFVVSRHLANQGVSVDIVLCTEPKKIKGEAKVNYDICRAMKLPLNTVDIKSPDMYRDVEQHLQNCDMAVDAILGTGLSGELKSPLALLISSMNAHNMPIVSVDIPSGMDCDTGLPLPVCIEAAATVTFAAIKKGFVECRESRAATGRVFVADIGITPATFEAS